MLCPCKKLFVPGGVDRWRVGIINQSLLTGLTATGGAETVGLAFEWSRALSEAF